MRGQKPLKLVYCTPALYMAGGAERVLTLKANYLADHLGYDVTIILTEGKDKPMFYQLSEKVKVINLDINFEELWTCSFLSKALLYLKKQRVYKKLLTQTLLQLHPDITVTMLRREVNFINSIADGSCKVGELHVNRAHYRNFEAGNTNFVKELFSRYWMSQLLKQLRRLDKLVVLTEKDREAWPELSNVVSIPNPLSFHSAVASDLSAKRVILVGRYCHEKGYDHLLQAWKLVQERCPDWRLDTYGDGDTTPYEQLINELGIDRSRCSLNPRVENVQQEFQRSSIAVCTSRFEGFCMAIIEAMACGVPVVSFNCPWGPQSIITDGVDGLLVENGNVAKMAETLTSLIADAERRKLLASNGLKSVHRYDMDAIGEHWNQLFKDVFQKRKTQ